MTTVRTKCSTRGSPRCPGERVMSKTSGVSRRGFLGTAAAGMGAVAIAATAKAAEMAATPATDAPAPAGAAPTAATKAAATGAKKLEDVLKVAREKLYPRCRVCPECDGQACMGEVPGLGGIGSGMSF